MPKTSAGVLPYRRVAAEDDLEVFIAHMGGPLWARRDAGGWSMVKGEYDATAENPLDVARREFAEEVGVPAPAGVWLPLGAFRQPSGKVVTAYAVAVAEELVFAGSNLFEMEWPRGSGRIQRFPEVDRAQWWPISVARTKVVSGQVPILDRLQDVAGDVAGG